MQKCAFFVSKTIYKKEEIMEFKSNTIKKTNNQKYFTPQQAKKMGYFRPEYVDGSKPYEQWFNAKGQRIYVQRIDPLSDLRKNTGKSGFRMHESKTNKNVAKISENTLRQIVAESVKKVLNEEQGRDGMLSGGEVLDKNIKNGNTTGDIRLMCEFLQKYVIPNGEEQDGKFIYREHAVDVTEINRSIYEAMRYLYKIVKQFGY